MELNERYKKFPINFYQLEDGTIEYESGFTYGSADSLNLALNNFSDKDFAYDLFYFYDDVVDVKFGSFEPAINNKKSKGRKYLGKLNLELDLNDFKGPQTVTYLSKNKQYIPMYNDYIKNHKEKLKKEERKSIIKNKILNIINKVKNMLKKPVNEMFTPYKATQQHICKHCGVNIEIGTYFEEYRNEAYHLECIWDKLINKKPTNSYKEAQKFFLSLEKFIGNWPAYGYDVEDDYVSDLELVKHNYRITKQDIIEDIKKLNEEMEKVINEWQKDF